jgi:hypothetical protein
LDDDDRKSPVAQLVSVVDASSFYVGTEVGMYMIMQWHELNK